MAYLVILYISLISTWQEISRYSLETDGGRIQGFKKIYENKKEL